MIIMSQHLLHLKSDLTGHLKRILKKIRTMTKKMMMISAVMMLMMMMMMN